MMNMELSNMNGNVKFSLCLQKLKVFQCVHFAIRQ